MTYQAVLFDLDGTLLDTIEDLADSMNAALGALGLATRTVAQCKRFVGDGIVQYALRALPEGSRDDETVQRCIELMRAEYTRRWHAKTRPYEGIAELLDGLTRRGVAMSVLSNKPDDFTKLMVGEMLGNWRFEVVRGVGADGVKKPDPAGAIEIAQQLGVDPAAFLYVGDTDTDMQTAVAAGMFPVGCTWGFREAAELAAHGAKVLVDRPTELLELLGGE
jgi:phosphoglycolate phosphatase